MAWRFLLSRKQRLCSKECGLGSDTSSCPASGGGSGGKPEAGAGWKVLAGVWVRGAGDWGQGRDGEDEKE